MTRFDVEDVGTPSLFDGKGDSSAKAMPRSLVERFGVPPFTTLDTRQGYWQARKRAWLSLGIEAELGRTAGLTYGRFDNPAISAFGSKLVDSQTSVFDPVLCEMAYRWFAPARSRVYDPFAGGSVRGVIAALLGHSYIGIELRDEQVQANRRQAGRLFGPGGLQLAEPVIEPRWICDDAMQASPSIEGRADLVFTCPPYADLEVYSDDPRDLSRMSYGKFMAAYRYIAADAVERLKDDRFAVVVVGDVRDKRGRYRGLTAHTIEAFENAGADFYNEAILINGVGTGAVRARKQFQTSRKLVRLHQSMLVFVKGDPRAATAACGVVDDTEGLEDAA